MIPLADKKQPAAGEPAQRFWIDPDAEVALTAQINEHFPPEGAVPDKIDPATIGVLMSRYNRGDVREAVLARSFGETGEEQAV